MIRGKSTIFNDVFEVCILWKHLAILAEWTMTTMMKMKMAIPGLNRILRKMPKVFAGYERGRGTVETRIWDNKETFK